MYDNHNLPIIARSSYHVSARVLNELLDPAISYQSLFYALIVPSTYTTTSVTLSPLIMANYPAPSNKRPRRMCHFDSLESGVAQNIIYTRMYIHQ